MKFVLERRCFVVVEDEDVDEAEVFSERFKEADEVTDPELAPVWCGW